ncbi:MAG: GNAT family N-acetyltransferase [Candidatus Omnitrophica bacterium]|nr:GNAT family N-acetyltransferase [Candidatus Omnitrophota bacterium]
MYIYEDVGFRPIEIDDLEILRKLHNDMSTLLQLGDIELFSSEQQVVWWKSLINDNVTRRYSIVEVALNKVIGILRVQNISFTNRNCEVGLDILPSYRGKGFGVKSYKMILEYLFLHFNMHMVYLKVGDFNEKAGTLYERIGFVKSGRFKEFLFRDGKYWDYNIYTLLRRDYLKDANMVRRKVI